MKQKIITVDAKAFFKYFPKEIAEDQKCFTLKYANRALYKLVVQQENEMEDCPLFHQFFKEIEKSWNSQLNDEPFKITNTTLFDKFVIVDFGDIFFPLDEISSFPGQKERHEDYLENAKDIVENGFDIYFKNHEKPVHMIAFDKSGNMSRHSRISFIDENYYAGLNTRLNLGMDFSKIPVKESKYYSYRGLYLSSSKRINHKKLIIDADTIVVLHDVRKDEKNPSKPITGYYYDKGITIATAKLDVEEDGSKEKINCTFLKTKREELLEVDIPFDGAGFISPEYASYINEALGTTGATSFQMRLPFMKGMLHEVDVHQFLEEYNIHKDGEENWYKDVFGKKRDLSKAHIFITESMFKGMKWLIKHLSNLEDNKYGHPMEFYCDAMNKYEHALYISGTNLPYGHSKFTHLSYQMINTLDFSKEQFSNVINHHCNYIENPIDFLKEWGNNNDNNVSNDYSKRDKIGLTSDIPNWKKAVFKNQKLKTDVYITKQLQNTQKGLLTKLAKGKILVEGQTRYLCRDLLPLLVSLLEKKKDILGFYPRYLYGRFYLPMEDYREERSMNRNQYENTMDYKKALKILNSFVEEELDGDIDAMRAFCFDNLTKFIGNIGDPDMYLIVQAIYIILWGDIYDLTFEKMGAWDLKGTYAFRGDTINSFGSLFGKESKENEFGYRAKFFGADKDIILWNKIKEFSRLYHQIGNFIVIPNRSSNAWRVGRRRYTKHIKWKCRK